MSEHAFVLCVCILTVLAHISLLWHRGWLIGECRKEQSKMRCQWEDFKQEQEKWRKDFENEHRAPWQRSNTRRTA